LIAEGKEVLLKREACKLAISDTLNNSGTYTGQLLNPQEHPVGWVKRNKAFSLVICCESITSWL